MFVSRQNLAIIDQIKSKLFEAWKTRFRVLQPHCKPRRRLESTLAPRPLSNMKRAGWRPCCLKLKDQVNCVKKYIQTDLINSKFNALEQ